MTPATTRASLVRAANPGPMTLDGTNTWVLREPGGRAVVVDPGPGDPAHRDAVVAAAGPVAVIVLTHGHPDHAAGAAGLAERTGAPVRAVDPGHTRGGDVLSDGVLIDVDGLELRVVGTPGHTTDSICLLLAADAALLTGDTVLGRGSTVVAHPDGRLADYLDSLHRLRDLVVAAGVRMLLPGHGPVRSDPLAVVEGYLAHRAERLAAVRAALAAGATDPAEVVRRVYADVDPVLWPAAQRSVAAQLEYIRDERRRLG